MRIAVIDIGTNTVLMLMAQSSTDSLPIIIRDEHSIARLGEGVDNTKHISEEAYNRFSEIMKRYSNLISISNIDRVVAFATSAMRDAENRQSIINRIQEEYGIGIELLSGDDEAHWSFCGALYGLKTEQFRGSIATIDIGGGSTEISIGTDCVFHSGTSIDIGAVRIKERFLSSNMEDSILKARSYIRTQLVEATTTLPKPHSLIAVAGTPTSLAAMKHQLREFDVTIVDGTTIEIDELSRLIDEMFSITVGELISRYPAISPARADILPAGSLILYEAMVQMGLEQVRVSTKGLRYGILLRELSK